MKHLLLTVLFWYMTGTQPSTYFCKSAMFCLLTFFLWGWLGVYSLRFNSKCFKCILILPPKRHLLLGQRLPLPASSLHHLSLSLSFSLFQFQSFYLCHCLSRTLSLWLSLLLSLLFALALACTRERTEQRERERDSSSRSRDVYKKETEWILTPPAPPQTLFEYLHIILIPLIIRLGVRVNETQEC